MISRLRKQITVFLWFAAAIFIAFIFFQWGMRFASSRTMTESNRGIIAEVNGTEISTLLYNNLVRNYLEMGFTEDQASDSAFYTLVEATILRDYYDNADLNPSDKEVVDAIKTNPPPQILEDTLFYTDGKFDYLKYAELFKNPENIIYFRQYEAWIRDVIPRQRLHTQLISTVQPTALINEYLKERTIFSIEYGELSIDEVEIDLDEQELPVYYERKKELFKRPEAKLVKYIEYELSPSVEDENMIVEEANDIISQYESGVPFDTLVIRFSDDAKSKTDLGYMGFAKRGELDKKFEDAIFSMSKGDIKGPIETDEGLYIFKCLSRTRDSVEVSQIFLRLSTSYETMGVFMDRAYAFIELAEEIGFEKAALSMNLEIRETTTNEIAGFDLSGLLSKSKMGKISPPLPRKDGIYVWTYERDTPERIPPLSEIKDEVQKSYIRERREKKIISELIEVKNDAEKGSSLKSSLKNIKVKYNKAQDFTITDPPGDLPVESAFYGAVWALNKGELSGPVIGEEKCFIIKCLKREQPETETIQEEFPEFQVEEWRERRDRAFREWLNSQIANANIKDYRYQL